MADQFPNEAPLHFTEAEVRRGVELLYFGYSNLTRAIDERLATQGLGRAHHRALYFIARQPGLTVSDLIQLLHITKQSLSRIINDLLTRELVEMRGDPADGRRRLLHLTTSGRAMEDSLFNDLRFRLENAYLEAGTHSTEGFWKILEGLIPPGERERVFALR